MQALFALFIMVRVQLTACQMYVSENAGKGRAGIGTRSVVLVPPLPKVGSPSLLIFIENG